MRLKNFVEIIALLFVFIVGNILLIGLISDENFKLIYFIFLIILMIIILFAKRGIFENRSEILYVIIIGILICLSLTYFFSNIKLYYEINYQNQEDIQQQTQLREIINISYHHQIETIYDKLLNVEKIDNINTINIKRTKI